MARLARVDRSQDGSSLVSADWIEAHRRDPSVRLIEVDVSPAAYEEGHIPGAVLWNAYTDLRGPDYQPVTRKELGGLLSRSGIAPGIAWSSTATARRWASG